MMGIVERLKESSPVAKRGCKKGNGVFLINQISPLSDIPNNVVVRLVRRQPACQNVNFMSLCGQPGRLFKKDPFRAAQLVLNGNIGNKKYFHLQAIFIVSILLMTSRLKSSRKLVFIQFL